MRAARSSFDASISAVSLLTLVFLLAPLVMVVVNSVGPEGLAFFPPPNVSLAAYATIPGRWLNAAFNSVALALLASALAGVFGTCAALALVRGRWRSGPAAFIDGVLRLPLQAPALVIGVSFLQYYAWLNATAGIDVRGSFLGLLFAHTAVSIPFVLTVVLARLVSFDRRLEEAANGLGATPLQTFIRVTFPIIAPAVLSGCFFAFLLSLDNVPLSLFLVGAGFPLLPVDLFTSIQFDLTRTIYAVATLVCLFTTVIVGFAFRYLTSVLTVARA
jgi:putative spermidine/putrescine transport system permease protein